MRLAGALDQLGANAVPFPFDLPVRAIAQQIAELLRPRRAVDRRREAKRVRPGEISLGRSPNQSAR